LSGAFVKLRTAINHHEAPLVTVDEWLARMNSKAALEEWDRIIAAVSDPTERDRQFVQWRQAHEGQR